MARPFVFRFVAIGVASAAALLALPAEAQWKWRDKSGHVQYSDLPPPSGTADQDILARPSPTRRFAPPPQASASAAAAGTAASGALAPRTVEPELEVKRKKVEAEQAAKAKADEQRVATAKADNCARARNQMKTLDSGIRVARTNDKGEREYLDDAQREAEARRTRDVIANDCK